MRFLIMVLVLGFKDIRITPLISKQATFPFQHSGARRQANI